MDFGALPPEINSARMYSGAGSGPMLAAAAAWDGLAAELHSAAASYGSVVSGLTGGQWLGPASTSMAAAAAPYVTWMSTTAAQATQAAAQARAAAGAYEAAFAMTAPPPLIAANRGQLMSLVATNIFGQNTPAIAATETHYGEMWAQDSAAMYGYAGSSAAASELPQFTPPPQSTNPAGQAAQGAAVAQATGTSAATNAQTMLSQLTSAVPQALQGLASGQGLTSSTSSTSPLDALKSLQTVMSPMSTAAMMPMRGMSMANLMKNLSTPAKSIGLATSAAGKGAAALGSGLTGGFGSGAGALGSVGLGGAGVSAGLGRATTVGALSVPQAWSATAPAISPATAALSATGSAAPAAAVGAPGHMLSGMPLMGLAGRGTGGAAPRYPFNTNVVPRSPAAG